MKSTTFLGILLAAALVASPAAAQSLFSSPGLGTPLSPVDARAQALGGIGVGLMGLNSSLVNPASVAGVAGRGAAVGMQPVARTFEFEGESDAVGGTRFPLMHVVYPTRRGITAGIGYGGFLDQSWSVVTEGTQTIAGEPVATRDLVESTGGIAQVRLTLAYQLLPSLAVGVSGGSFTGRIDRTFRRTFPDTAGPVLDSFEDATRHQFTAPLGVLGVRWDPAGDLRLAGSLAWAGELHAEAASGSEDDRRYDMPLKATVGASATLASDLLGVVGFEWSGWESMEDAFEADDAVGDVWTVGGGLEWNGAQLGQRALPLRAGFRYGRLPFKLEGESVREWSGSLGAGFRFAGDPDQPIAALDAVIERGARGDAAVNGLVEDFWRATVSLALFGF